MKNEEIPWNELFKLCVTYLNISVSEFWQLTFKELGCLLKNNPNTPLFTKEDLKALQAKFPD